MKQYILSFFVLIGLISMTQRSFAQQDPQYSHFMFNQMTYNPAYAGLDDALSATLLVRNQWVGFDGLPLTQTLNAHAPFSMIHGGAGLAIVNDIEGAERTTSAVLSYAYHMKVQGGKLSIGIGAGLIQNALDGSKLRAPQGDYENGIDHNDQYIPVKMTSALAPDFSFGIYYKTKKMDVGFGASHLAQPVIHLEAPTATTNIQYLRHFFFNAGYNIQISDNVMIRPNIMVKSDITQTQAELNATVFYKNSFWGGLSFRGYSKNSYDALIGMIGLNITDRLRAGYSYDFNVSGLRNYNSGTHELVLNYRLPFGQSPDPGKIIYNPRDL